MSAPTSNPVAYTYTYTSSDAPPNTGSTSNSIAHPPSISKIEHVISGIKTSVYGLAELPPSSVSADEVAVLWLLHPRLQTRDFMEPFAAHLIHHYYGNDAGGTTGDADTTTTARKGLIAVSFDQRNHGTREISPLANEAWRSGNETHAQDMFSCYHGTSVDASQLLDHLAAYIFPPAAPAATSAPSSSSSSVRTTTKAPSSSSGQSTPTPTPTIVQNVVLGISLGGHAAWHVLMQDPRFTAAIVTIGCPDYARLMADRARLSKRSTWTVSAAAGFLGSSDFPPGLVDAVQRFDPAGLLWGANGLGLSPLEIPPPKVKSSGTTNTAITPEQEARLASLMKQTLGGKRVLNLSGGADKLVPYAMGEPFLDWLKGVTGEGGVFADLDFHLEDVVVPGAGHEVPPDMVKHMARFLVDTLSQNEQIGKSTASKNAAGSWNKDSRI